MTTPSHRSGSDATAGPAPFSYAQAAKGLSLTANLAATQAKQPPGTSTPAKDINATAATAPAYSITSWADDVEVNGSRPEKQPSRPDRSHGPAAASKAANAQPQAPTSSISSPDLGASSSSTVTKDDDVSSLQNTSSESTWENKSQASTSVEKAAELSEKTVDKVKSKNLEKSTFKPLQEAPVPVVNVWKLRAEEAKVKAQNASTSKPAPGAPAKLPNGSIATASLQKSRGLQEADDTSAKDRTPNIESKTRAREEDNQKSNQARKDARSELESDKTKKGTKGRPGDKESKPTSNVLPLPPVRDQESWPTPLSVVDEDKKKAQVKGDKGEKERKEGTVSRAHGKQEWVSVPYTPNVIFSTPLPNTTASRRGGRSGGRGGAQNSSRSAGNGPNQASSSDKDAAASQPLSNGEQSRRGRSDGPRDSSPVKERRAVSASSTSVKEAKPPALPVDKSPKPMPTPATEASSRGRASVLADTTSGSLPPNQSNTLPRQYPSNRPYKGRKGESSYPGERRKDSESVSPTKDGSGPLDRRASMLAQTETGENGERRASTFQEGPNGQIKASSTDRRYGSFPRERGRGNPRGRGTYSNGHQYSNGHTPTLQNSASFPLQSPNGTFFPESNQNFNTTSSHGRHRGPRSQSVTNENMYNRFPGYPSNGPQMMPPLQTVIPGMYDYPPMQPMSAMPYSPYTMENQPILFSMVTTQLEYYFSVENLCKDIFLRKHMDSQGFVFLHVVAQFNRVKHLTTDLDLIKLACYQSREIELRVGPDGKDRLRRQEGWEQWVLGVGEREPSAQNEGPDEVHMPPIPHPSGFTQAGMPRFPDMSASSTGGHPPFNDFYPSMNGFQHSGLQPAGEEAPNGVPVNGINGAAITNGHSADEPDSFSDEQVETLSVIVRKQDPSQSSLVPPSVQRTFSNGSVDNKSGIPDEGLTMNGTLQGDQPPTLGSSPPAPVRLYWVKGKDGPVDSVPADSTYESYTQLRSKALEQRQVATVGTCPYDMDVLYQFWSHFLIRNFNMQMYEQFRHLALDDLGRNSSVGIQSLIKFYTESLLSSQIIRERVARHFAGIVKEEQDQRLGHTEQPAFLQLRSALRNSALDARNRKCIIGFLDPDLKVSLEQ